MSTWIIADEEGRRWLTVTRTRALVALAILLPALGAVVAQQFAAPASRWWPAIPVLGFAAFAASSPDSVRGAFFIGAYAVWWLESETDETTLWSLVAALCLLAFHSAVAFAAAGPRGLEPDRANVLRWLRDTGVVALATWAMWLLVAGLHGTTQSSEVLLGLCLLLVAALVMASTGPRPSLPTDSPLPSARPGQDSGTG